MLFRSVRGTEREYVSLVNALAMTNFGALPCYSTFAKPGSTGAEIELGLDIDRALDTLRNDAKTGSTIDAAAFQRLKRFAEHPCVRACLRDKNHRIRIAGVNDSRVTHTTIQALTSMVTITGPRAEFISSVMQLEEFAYPEKGITKAP